MSKAESHSWDDEPAWNAERPLEKGSGPIYSIRYAGCDPVGIDEMGALSGGKLVIRGNLTHAKMQITNKSLKLLRLYSFKKSGIDVIPLLKACLDTPVEKVKMPRKGSHQGGIIARRSHESRNAAFDITVQLFIVQNRET